MTFEIGNLTLKPTAPAPPVPNGSATRLERPAAAVAAGIVDRADVIPMSPPPEVLAEVDAAWERAGQLAVENRELHFARDRTSGRVIIEVRTLDGEVLRTIPPSRALDVIGGAAL